MQLSFTEKKNIRKSFGKLKESLSIPNLIEVQKNSYKELTEFKKDVEQHLVKGFDRVFKSIFPIDDLRSKMREHGIKFKITNNRITKLALEKNKMQRSIRLVFRSYGSSFV